MDLGVINKPYVSAIDSELDIRDIRPGVVNESQDNRLSDILNIAGRKRPVRATKYSDFANEAMFKTIDTTGVTVGGTGTNTISLPTLASGSSGYTRKGDLLMSQGTGNPVFYVSNVTTSGGQDSLTLKSVDGAAKTFTAGTILNPFSRAAGERADSPVNLRFNLHKYTNKVQIFDEVSQVSDIQQYTYIEVEFKGQKSYMVKDWIDKTIRAKTLLNAAIWGGRLSSTSFSDTSPFLVDNNAPTGGGGGGAVQTTRGINEYVEAYGITQAVGTLGTISMTDWSAIATALYAARATGDMTVYGSGMTKSLVDIFWKNLGSSGITSARLDVNGTDVNTPVDRVSFAGYNWNFATMPIFNHPNLFPGTMITKSLFFLPMDAQVEMYDNETGQGSMAPSIEIRYLPQDGMNNDTSNSDGLWAEIQSGAKNPVYKSGTIRESRTDWVTYQGVQAMGATMMARLRVQS